MSKTILAQVDGFTPLIDSLVDEYGVIGAAIFGRIWRYCQGKQGECTAPMSQIGKELDLDKSTISRYVARLVSDQYIEDLTPDAGNTPHAYRDTGKAGLQISISASKKSVAQNNRALHKTTQRCTEQQSVAQNNTHIRNIETKKQEETTLAPTGASPSVTISDIFTHWQQVMNKPQAHLTVERIKKVRARLSEKYTAVQIKLAIDGCAASEWHQGKNDRDRTFNDLELICRDGKHLEEFIEMAKGKAVTDEVEALQGKLRAALGCSLCEGILPGYQDKARRVVCQCNPMSPTHNLYGEYVKLLGLRRKITSGNVQGQKQATPGQTIAAS